MEDLLFRRFMKGEDITASMPPTPHCDVNSYLRLFDQASKAMNHYVRNGPPVVPLSAHHPNIAASSAPKSAPMTPVKSQPQYAPPPPMSNGSSQPPKTPLAKAGSAPDKAAVVPKTPKSSNINSATIMRDAVPPPVAQQQLGSMPPPPSPSSFLAKRDRLEGGTPKGGKRNRIEWPAEVPTNVMLKSKSRSAVAHLTSERVRAQQCFDPDLVFQQPKGELPLHTIFANFPKALKAIAAIRGSSGDWHDDAFTLEEEVAYKKDVGVVYVGPSQCTYGAAGL